MKQHDSDCAIHNMPALLNGPCDCSAKTHPTLIEITPAFEMRWREGGKERFVKIYISGNVENDTKNPKGLVVINRITQFLAMSRAMGKLDAALTVTP